MNDEEEFKVLRLDESSHSLMDNPLAQDVSKIEQANLTFKKKRDIEDVSD